MNIVQCLGADASAIAKKEFNIWIGISLGNKKFTDVNIEAYIKWALEFTKDDVLVVIGDTLHAINLEVLDGYSKTRALTVAVKLGDEIEQRIRDICSKLNQEQQEKIKIVRFGHVSTSKYHNYRLEVLRREFETNAKFRESIINILHENKKVTQKNLSPERLNKLAEYILQEIPIYLNGVKYGGLPEHGGRQYLLNIYPGTGLIDELLINLQDGKSFPQLTKSLKITDKICIVDGHVA